MGTKTRAESRSEKLKRSGNISFGQKIKPFLSFKHPITRFCLLFLGLLASSTILLGFKIIEHYLYDSVTEIIASQAAWILKTLGMEVTTSGIIISGEGFSVKIGANCNAIFEMFLFLSAVIAFPALLKEKLIGGILGAIFIYLINLLRIAFLFLVGIYSPQYFEVIHLYIMQSVYIVLIAMLWLFWVGNCVRSVPVE